MPPEVQKLHSAIDSIPGVTDVLVGKADLSDLQASDLSLVPYGDLPLGSLRRTKGGLASEVLVSVSFGITRDEQGLRALEFISWWVRDAARGTEPIQIRSLALPPIGEQFGTSLRFTIAKLADGLNRSKSLYPEAVAP